jgi:site-specific recombinase XerD
MQVSDINFEYGTVLIPSGKGDKSRELTMPPECEVAFRTWVVERQKLKCQHDGFWAYGSKRGISADNLRELLEEIKAIAGFRGAANIKSLWDMRT